MTSAAKSLQCAINWFQNTWACPLTSLKGRCFSAALVKAIESLLGQGKTLRPVTKQTVSGEASALAASDLTDPDHVPRSLARGVQRFIAGFRG
jgi:hypothetical protein